MCGLDSNIQQTDNTITEEQACLATSPADLVFLRGWGGGASLVSYSRVEKQENFCTFEQFEPIVSNFADFYNGFG